jgi:hypoxanthine phosphoribosyltransferase
MDEMINAATAWIPLLTIDPKNSYYYNFSVLFFSLVAASNHVLPENLDGFTHLVKLLFSNVLFSLINLNPFLGILLSLSDLIPLFTNNKSIKQAGELFMQIPRQFIEFYLIYGIINEHPIDCSLMILFKLIYYLERKARIKIKTRNDYSILHSAEHIGLYLLFKDLNGIEFNIKLFINLLIVYIIIVALYLNFVNHYIQANIMERAPEWVKENPTLKGILFEKISKNKQSYKWQNFVVKPWLSHLKLEFVTWRSIEHHCNIILEKINPDNFDIVVGIVTGGSFIGGYMAKKIDKPFLVINSKLWSDISFKDNFVQSYSYFLGYDFQPKIGEVPDVKDKRILLADDTTYTGITMKNVIRVFMENGAKSIETVCLWYKGEYMPNYYYSNKRVPIIWEWGSEVD